MSVIRQTISRSLRSSLAKRSPSVITSVRFNTTNTTAAAAPTESSSPSSPVDPKITQIVDQISTLTLLETSQLVNELKSKLNISDIALPVAGAGGAGGAAAQAAPAEEEEAKQPVEEKTMFAIKLESFDAKSKPKVIKEVKGLLGLSLVESKKFVESAPKVLKENVAKEDAEKIKATLEGLGAKVVLE
ncbi:MNP1 [Candida theae]|uniref:MNP1 n=1 Tax=Candida theae TaxID=1198502 RepID=A0AAD5BGF9_9ASCO|nr:MNP1 [Candida theae]KAI5960898.1 MNP1 [Candida theae]